MRGKASCFKCENCGADVWRTPSQIRKHVFCSSVCDVEWRKRVGLIRGENNGNWNGGIGCTCEVCGKAFKVKRSRYARGNVAYCSWECRRLAGSDKKMCEVCGKEFWVKKSHVLRKRGHYCSLECRSIGYQKRGVFAGENNPNFANKGSATPEYVCRKSHQRRMLQPGNSKSYTLEEWHALCAKYGYRCLACGKGDVPLTVDHIVPISKGGANDISNLQPLCKSCNSKKHVRMIDYRLAWKSTTRLAEPVAVAAE